ncbi:NAD kinase 2, mitochondrial [Coccinella septempunctata]|uniref:NAD kinase 2, mitochondrial n=1 Tax=Coccinella septempunctata TaxID=41139 RepID=UPI001D0703CB|nr:NAD kinase 2, mitochondrial [Coccinella septempunctata]
MHRNRLLKSICSGWNYSTENLRNASYSTHDKLKMDKVLILSKLTRYDYERMKFQTLNDKDFEKKLRTRGTNFDKLKHHNELQKTNVAKIAKALKDTGSDVKIVNRFSYNKEAISWADCVLPAGGDGTFLLAASLIRNSDIPVVGINSDPNRSEGFLCLPKEYSCEPREAFEKLKSGNFKWMFRSRIRSKIKGATKMEPKLLHQIPFYDAEKIIGKEWEGVDDNGSKILPVLALNEIFIGETLSAKVSHLELNFDDADHFTNTKCSGLCICTGTGSTSWFYSINKISVQSVAEILRLMNMSPTEDKNSLATIYADMYNYNLKFAPDDTRMGFSIRDLISAGVWPDPKGLKPRGFAKKIIVKSNCDEAYIVVDGGLSFAFNDGAIGIFELHPEDNLRTVILD